MVCVKDQLSLQGKDSCGPKSIILLIQYSMIFLYFFKVHGFGVCVVFVFVLLYVTDEHLVTGDSSSIDNMLAEENSIDNNSNTSNVLKYVCLFC